MRRVIFYLVYDRDGRVGDYVLHSLAALRPSAEHIFVVANSTLEPTSAARLAEVADTVWERPNVGFDVWAYRDALRTFGQERLSQYDELVLMNYTFYGPIGTYEPMLERMDAMDVDFWGVTDHGAVRPNPYTFRGVMHRHIQSHWIAVRRSMFTSEAWRRYWSEMPPITSYADSIQQHEARFTHHFESEGFRSAVAFPESDYPARHPIFDVPQLMLDDGLPIIKRRLFFHDPLYHDEHAVRARGVEDRMRAAGYPMELLWADQARTAQPKTLNANLSMLEIKPDVDEGGSDPSSLRVGVLAHVFYEDMIDDILDHADTIPGGYTLIATTTDEIKQRAIEERLHERGRSGDEVRVVESNRGRDISAFLLSCGDVLTSGAFDVIVKLHSKRSPQDGYARGAYFKDHLFENLLHSPGYTTNVLRMFRDDPTLGMVFPPMIHIGFPTVGGAWFTNKEPAQRLADRLGIDVPFDSHSPLAPFGSMLIARPEAFRRLVEAGFEWQDFPEEGGYADGSLPHQLERLLGYAALAEGFHIRTVMHPAAAAESHTMLEHKLDEMSAGVPGNARQKIDWVRMQLLGGTGLGALKIAVQRKPALAKALKPAYAIARSGYRAVRGRRR